MIDVKNTILETIKDKIKKLRFLGQNDPKILKKILSLIILDDLYEWSDYLDDSQVILKKLQKLRTDYILCLRDFIILYTPQESFYTNVNTPLTNYTWKRIWDSKEVIEVQDNIESGSIITTEQPTSFVPDPSCPISITYFGIGERIPAIHENGTGHPKVDLNSLTTCEKMDIYINRTTGQMYFLDPLTCKWETLKGDLATAITWNSIVDKPNIYGGIQHNLQPNDSKFNVSLLEVEQDEEGHWNFNNTSDDVAITGTEESIDDVL